VVFVAVVKLKGNKHHRGMPSKGKRMGQTGDSGYSNARSIITSIKSFRRGLHARRKKKLYTKNLLTPNLGQGNNGDQTRREKKQGEA